MKNLKWTSLLTFKIISLLMLSSLTLAASISQVKGDKAIIYLDGDTPEIGTQYYAIEPSTGKRRALLEVKQIKGNKALTVIKKGKAQTRWMLQAKVPREKQEEAALPRNTKLRGGLLAGYAMNSLAMTVVLNSARREDATLTGTSMSFKVFGDYALSTDITVRGATGYESFSTKATTSSALCADGTTTACEATYTYLPLEASAHYNFINGKSKYWIGLGFSFLLEMSRTVNIPNLDSSSKTNQMLLVGLGGDIGLSNGKFIPVVLEYGMFPGSTNVTASSIAIRTGYGMSF